MYNLNSARCFHRNKHNRQSSIQRLWIFLTGQFKTLFASIVLITSLFSTSVYAATVEGVRLWRAPDHTRLVFDLSGPASHEIFMLKNPARLVMDIPNSKITANVNILDLENTPVKKVRHGARNGNDLRVVFDLGEPVKPRSFSLKAQSGKPDRLVVDLYDKEKKTIRSIDTMTAKKTDEGEYRDIVVAIDAGHGGEDPGALGPKGLREKDVVLKISQTLYKLINAEPGYKAVMIRDGDYYVPLKARRNKARKHRADLFVSIHADAFTNPKARGASVFALSRRGATSELARFLASKENAADLIGGVGNVSLDDKDDDVAKLLVDLSMTSTLANSLEVGSHVLKKMGGIAHLHKNHVEQAGFLVLKSPDVPSILVETGFISNPQEAKKLSTPSHRRKLARAVFTGVKEYFYSNPPEDSYVAWKKLGGQHIKYTIASGDTLSAIAKRYNITLTSLKKANQLSGENIKIGQTLMIPAS